MCKLSVHRYTIGAFVHVASAFAKGTRGRTLDKGARNFSSGLLFCREEKLGLSLASVHAYRYYGRLATGSRMFIQFSCDNVNVTGLLPSSLSDMFATLSEVDC